MDKQNPCCCKFSQLALDNLLDLIPLISAQIVVFVDVSIPTSLTINVADAVAIGIMVAFFCTADNVMSFYTVIVVIYASVDDTSFIIVSNVAVLPLTVCLLNLISFDWRSCNNTSYCIHYIHSG